MEIGLNTQQLRTEPAQNKVQEKKLKSTADAEERKEIKKKLEQIKRQLKAAEH